MMYLHFCQTCSRIHILNGHKMFCPKCNHTLKELQMSYLDYVALNSAQRELFIASCHDENHLHKISTTYRMYKYSKWYRDSQSVTGHV